MEEKVLRKVLKVSEGDDFVKHLRKAVNSGRRGKCQEVRREADAQDAEVGTEGMEDAQGVAREVGESWNYAGHKGKDKELEQDAVAKGGVGE